MSAAEKENNEDDTRAGRAADPTLDVFGHKKLGARGRGRPSKLNKKLMDDVCNMIREVNHPHVACARVGVTPQAMNAWRRRGKAALEALAEGGEAAAAVGKEEMPYADFEAAIHQSEADRTALLVRLNLRHAQRNPETAWRMLVASDPAYREQRTVTANVKNESEHRVSGTVDHRHAHLHANAGGAGGAGAGGTLTVQGADALRRDALLGGKSIEQARFEHAEAKRMASGSGGGVAARVVPAEVPTEDAEEAGEE